MATLNIKNFPDELYERLQKLAEQERRSVAQQAIHLVDEAIGPRRTLSIMDLDGLGKEVWEGVDASEYIKKERNSWD